MKTRCFEHCVNQSLVLFAAFEEPFSILDISAERRYSGRDMLAVLHTKDSVLCMGRSVRGTKNGLDGIVLDHLFQGWVRLFTFRLLGHFGAPVAEQITDRNQLDVGMMLEAELQAELTNTMADNSNPDLAVAKGLPDFCFVIIRFCLVKTGDIFSSLSETEYGTSGCSSSGNG
jgi:hypothetical protein